MFVRQKKNKSGVISVQVIDKSSGKYKVIKTLGSSSSISRVEMLVKEGGHWIKSHLGQAEIDLSGTQDAFDKFISNIQQVTVAGTDLLLGKLFDEIGFFKIKDDLFRKLVLSRLCFPVSKVRTIDYLKKHHGIEIDEDRVYRYLDKLYNKQKDLVQQISYQHTLRILNNQMSIVFYDVTTLYFENWKGNYMKRVPA
ncbi:hypothetical protein OQZ33_20630 [Pedobacter sp. MC2016-05]|uniref:hypothetical protein n=1 Tax=Pedobacter sp. MC2016-05 TaxID=2994474 RepID=UPI0022467C33|nr:hypothetical protein [Pedobacter sp. MC2016-05]MCX2476750.1 hypothetical protein [Pedobacter sp. MC2016-05]